MHIARWGAIGFLLLSTSSYAADFKVGDKVEAKSGGFWTPGKVVTVEGGRYRVHFDGRSSAFDEWEMTEAVRVPQPGASDTAAAAIARFNANTAKIRAERAGKKPPGNDPTRDAAPTDAATPAAVAPSTPTDATPAEGTPPQVTAPTAPKVGDALEVHASNGYWYPVTVTAVHGEQTQVHYNGQGPEYTEWATADRLRPSNDATAPKPVAETDAAAANVATTPAPATPAETTVTTPTDATAAQPVAVAPGSGGLDGLYHQLVQRFGFHGMMYSTDEYFWFRPDGYAYFGIPPTGLEAAADFSVLQKLDPKNCGSYSVQGGQLTYQRGTEKPHTYKLTTEQDNTVLNFDGPPAIKVAKFAAGQTLDASYFSDAIAADANTTVMSGSTIHFHADGTFDGGRFGGVDATGQTVAITGSATSAARGTYQINGNTITLNSGGKTVSLTTYPWPTKNETPPEHMGIGKEMYQLMK